MRTLNYKSWDRFREWTSEHAKRDRERRESFAFRGMADAGWVLETTLDRVRRFDNDRVRAAYYEDLLDQFEVEAMKVVSGPNQLPVREMESFELIARHYGVPSPLLDWTQSPYIAAFFAFQQEPKDRRKKVTVWILDRPKMKVDDVELQVIADPALVRFNRRAIQQRGLFLRVNATSHTLEDMLGDALTKVTLPVSSRVDALKDLDLMSINATTLLDDLEGAAWTAGFRSSQLGGGT